MQCSIPFLQLYTNFRGKAGLEHKSALAEQSVKKIDMDLSSPTQYQSSDSEPSQTTNAQINNRHS